MAPLASGNGGEVPALTCDLCSGSLEMGVGGLATCNDCGMKYTRERMQEKIQEMKGSGGGSSAAAGTSGPSVENLLELAGHALESGNMDEAEAYASRIVEADPRNYQAWITKGQAAGWQSSLRSIRIVEAANCFAKGVELAPEAERDHVETYVSGQISRMAEAIINLRAGIYVEYPEPDQAEPFEGDLRQILAAARGLLDRSGTVVDGILEDIATQINNVVVKAWSETIQPDYKNDPHPTDYDMQRFTSRLGAAINLLEISVNLSDQDGRDDVTRYKNMILFAENRRDAKSYEWTVNGYAVSKQLTAEAKGINNKLIADWRQRIKDLEEQEVRRKKDAEEREAQQRRDAYWATRQEEKQGLEHEQAKLQKRLAELQAKAEDYPGREELPGLTQQLVDLRAAHEATSRLKRAERKELQGQIDEAEGRRSQIAQAQLAARKEVAEELADVEGRLKAIQTELTKPR